MIYYKCTAHIIQQMFQARAPNMLIITTLLLLLAASSPINIQTVVPSFSALTFYITPLEDTIGSTADLSVAYLEDATLGTQTTIYSFSFVLTKQQRQYSVWNFEAKDQTIIINIASSAQLTPNMLRVDAAKSEAVFLAAFDKSTSSDYM
jgi:hypothetical protein